MKAIYRHNIKLSCLNPSFAGYRRSALRGARGVVALLAVALFTACEFDGDIGDCEFNTRLTYSYNRENTSPYSVLPQYIHSLDEYIFDELGVLVTVNRLPGVSCFGKYVSETNLPEGRYHVITWGNKAEPSKVNKEQIGVSNKMEKTLYLDNPYAANNESERMQNNSERLYYGYRTFSVNKYGVTKVNVDMTHAHCVVDITVRWKKDAEIPLDLNNFHMTVSQIPSNYKFIPEFVGIYHSVQPHNMGDETFESQSREVRHYIPVVQAAEQLVNHRATMRMNVARELRGEFISYRYRNQNLPLLTIYIGDNPLAGKTLNLQTFFNAMKIDLDRTLRQEYEILLEIDGNRINATLLSDITDWNEGGSLGG